jgi:hypothetical protein
MQQRHRLFPILLILVIALFGEQKIKAQSKEQIKDSSPVFMASMRNMKTMNTYLETSNKDIINSMMLIAETKSQFLPIAHTALEIKKLSTEFNKYITSLKESTGQESNGLYTSSDAKHLIGMPKDGGNKTGVEKIFMSEQQGADLLKKRNKLSADYLQLIDKLWFSGGIPHTLFSDPYRKEVKLKQFSDKFLFITSNDATSQETWIQENFKDKTIEEVFVFLTNLQNQVNLSTNSILSSLSEQIGRLEIYYDRFDISVQSEKHSVVLGENYEAKVGLGTYSTQARIFFSVDGQKLDIKHGKGQYTIKTTSLGEQTYRAKISIQNPLTGENETFSKTFKYEVIAPSSDIPTNK